MPAPVYLPSIDLVEGSSCVHIATVSDPEYGSVEIIYNPAGIFYRVVSDSAGDTQVFFPDFPEA